MPEDRAEPRQTGRFLRHRLRDDDAADGGRHQAGAGARAEELLRAVLSRADAIGDQHHPESPEVRQWGTVPLDGFIGPAHVSTIIGSRPYEFFAEEYRKPVVIAGFEPLDVMQAILMLVKQVNEGRAVVENEFSRAVTRDGNVKAQNLVAEVFELRRQFEWRGLNVVPYSGLRIRKGIRRPRCREALPGRVCPVADNKACGSAAPSCAASRNRRTARSSARSARRRTGRLVHGVLRGACAAHYTYGRYKDFQ